MAGGVLVVFLSFIVFVGIDTIPGCWDNAIAASSSHASATLSLPIPTFEFMCGPNLIGPCIRLAKAPPRPNQSHIVDYNTFNFHATPDYTVKRAGRPRNPIPIIGHSSPALIT
ncbi:hypothetical protein F4777DRAFT_329501 [Nemania sp. FL0916]|nr:hypothetical protein F4777DRAFT_329501 [Nemania sp. FL0916]